MGEPKESAGLLMFRRRGRALEVFLVHPGGPFFANKDEGAWSVPKGEVESDEERFAVARREFVEETGQSLEACARGGPFIPLGSVRQKNGKIVHAWAFEGDWPEGAVLKSNTCILEWPPRSGRRREIPEVDRGEFFSVAAAKQRINPAQAVLIDRLLAHAGPGAGPEPGSPAV